MLDETRLLFELQHFADPEAASFSGWPLGRTAARRAWARAFSVYVGSLVDTAPPLTPSGTTLVFAAVEDAFFSALGLVNGTATDAAADFAGAWRAALLGLAPGASATNAGATFTFAALDPVDLSARETTLQSDLTIAFDAHRSVRRDDLAELASAFHRATSGVISTATTFVVTYG